MEPIYPRFVLVLFLWKTNFLLSLGSRAFRSLCVCLWYSPWLITESTAHYNNVIMTTIASQITSLTVVYSIIYSGADQRKHQSYAALALCAGNSPGPVNFPHKGPVTRKIFPFDDVIMASSVCGPTFGVFSHTHRGDACDLKSIWGTSWDA